MTMDPARLVHCPAAAAQSHRRYIALTSLTGGLVSSTASTPKVSRPRQRHRVGTRWEPELPGRIVRGTPHRLGDVRLGRHCSRLLRK